MGEESNGNSDPTTKLNDIIKKLKEILKPEDKTSTDNILISSTSLMIDGMIEGLDLQKKILEQVKKCCSQKKKNPLEILIEALGIFFSAGTVIYLVWKDYLKYLKKKTISLKKKIEITDNSDYNLSEKEVIQEILDKKNSNDNSAFLGNIQNSESPSINDLQDS